MIPNIFISSTIQDLGHLRDSIRDLITELGYTPVMSEYGDIGYLPSSSAEESCYLALKDCHLAVIIIGKRYGSLSNNELSITHNEYRTARKRKIPVIFLVNEEVMSFKKVFDANTKNEELILPGMENPSKIFQLIKEFSGAEINNAFVQYSNVQSAKRNLKKQLAHIVGDLLSKQFDPVKGEIKDILSEISTLRHMLVKSDKELAKKYSNAFRFLLNEENVYLRDVIEIISGSLEEGVPELLDNPDLKSYLAKKEVNIKLLEGEELTQFLKLQAGQYPDIGLIMTGYFELPFDSGSGSVSIDNNYIIEPESADDTKVALGIGKKEFWANKNGEKYLEEIFSNLIEATI